MATPAFVDTTIHVEIPEDVRLTFRLAGPATRAAAYLVDLFIRVACLCGGLWVLALTSPFLRAGGATWGLLLVALFLLEWGYGTLFEGLWRGQTPGKRLLGLRVVQQGGHAIDFPAALVRNLLRAADALPAFYAAGLVSMALSTRLQRLGDLAAGTMVVQERHERLRPEPPDLEGARKLAPGELGSGFRPTERTLDLVHAFALRRPQLEGGRAREIAALLAEPLARRLAPAGAERGDSPDVFLLRVLRTFHGRP